MVFAQPATPLSSYDELIISITPSDDKSYTCHLNAKGKVWARDGYTNYNSHDYYLTNSYNNLSEPFYQNSSEDLGFEFKPFYSFTGHDIYAYGLYKVTISTTNSTLNTNAYFYIDFRDDNYGGYTAPPLPSEYEQTDIYLRWNSDNDRFELDFKGDNGNDYNPVTNGDLLRVWEEKQIQYANTSRFGNRTSTTSDDFWQNCLVLLKKNTHPWLIWGPHPNTNTSPYEIYRSVGNHISFTKIETVGASTYQYVDNQYSITNNGINIYYYVKSNAYPTQSNTVYTIGSPNKRIANEKLDTSEDIFNIENCYPNPFNPSTIINYQIKEDGYVTLKVYNSLGEELKELVNRKQEKGKYQVQFDARDLPSGIYFYKLQSGQFAETKKMLLVR